MWLDIAAHLASNELCLLVVVKDQHLTKCVPPHAYKIPPVKIWAQLFIEVARKLWTKTSLLYKFEIKGFGSSRLIFKWENTSFSKTTFPQRELPLTVFYTINSSSLLLPSKFLCIFWVITKRVQCLKNNTRAMGYCKIINSFLELQFALWFVDCFWYFSNKSINNQLPLNCHCVNLFFTYLNIFQNLTFEEVIEASSIVIFVSSVYFT